MQRRSWSNGRCSQKEEEEEKYGRRESRIWMEKRGKVEDDRGEGGVTKRSLGRSEGAVEET